MKDAPCTYAFYESSFWAVIEKERINLKRSIYDSKLGKKATVIIAGDLMIGLVKYKGPITIYPHDTRDVIRTWPTYTMENSYIIQ